MLFKTYYLLKRNKKKNQKFLERLRRKIEHILVDESQDLNRIQFMLVSILAGDNRRITMVGDDYQVLYGFRGARVQEIMNGMDIEITEGISPGDTVIALGFHLASDGNEVRVVR